MVEHCLWNKAKTKPEDELKRSLFEKSLNP